MKTLILLLWIFGSAFICLAATKEEIIENEILDSRFMANVDKVKHLMNVVEVYTRHDIPRSQREVELIEDAITEVIKTPGHAEVFADEIRQKQKEVAHIPILPRGNRNEYDNLRYRNILLYLSKLPSPESLRVLGEFLFDNKDWPEGPVPGDYFANNGHAMRALKLIGLRNPPDDNLQNESFKCMRLWQGWYEKVKAGEITFSFEGQPHEYRFKPDGTWVTIPLPQSSDSKKPVANEAVPETQTSSQHHAQENNTSRSPWIYAGVAFLILLITFTARKIITGKSTSAQP